MASKWLTFGLLLAVTVGIRLPGFFPAQIDWDEGTFILVGQSLLDGHLPYERLWDVKPPLLFAFFAVADALAGRDIVVIRLMGSLAVAASAFLVYLIASEWWSRRPAVWSAVLAIVGSTFVRSGQATLSEHVALVPLLGAVWLLHRDPSQVRLFAAGALMAVATLVRFNIAIVVLAGCGVVWAASVRHGRSLARDTLLYAAGGAAVAAVTCLPYAVAGQLALLWRATIVAAFSRATSDGSLWDNLVAQGHNLFAGDEGAGWFTLVLWAGAACGMVATWSARHRIAGAGVRSVVSLAWLALAMGVSILQSGGAYAHYLIQVAPFAAMLTAPAIQLAPVGLRRAALVAAVVLLGWSARPVLSDYAVLLDNLVAGRPVRYGTAYEIVSFLRRANADGHSVYLLTDHVAYWFLGAYPPTSIAHPSNIARTDVLAAMGTTAERELTSALARSAFVVVYPGSTFLTTPTGLRLRELLARDYEPPTDLEGRQVYRRRPTVPLVPTPTDAVSPASAVP